MKQSKGSKQLKIVDLSSLDGVREVALGHKATAERSPRNYSKSDYAPKHEEHSDVAARRKRWGF